MADFSRYEAKPLIGQTDYSGDGIFDYTTGFLQSSLESMGELAGIPPTSSTIKWRQDRPVSAFFSQLAGFGVPYAGWFKASKALKGFDKAVESIGDLQKSPISAGAMRTAGRFAPFEVGRVGVSQVVGDESFADMTADAVLSLALEGGVGGLIQGFASAGTRALPLDKLVPGLDLAAPVQLQTRYVQKLLDEGQLTGDAAAKANYRLNELRKIARSETVKKGERHVEKLDGRSKEAGDGINRLFNLNKKGTLRTQVLAQTQGAHGFRKRADVDAFTDAAGLGTNFEDYVQYPRAVTFKGDRADKTAGHVENAIARGLDPVGNGWFLGREADDGLFVVARKVSGEVGKPKGTDRWTVFKTDDPGRFMPSQQRWSNFMISHGAWVPGSKVAADGGLVYDATAKSIEEFPLRNYVTLSKVPGGVAKAIDRLVPQNASKESSELVGRVKDAIKAYATPARLQFGDTPRANWIHGRARLAYDLAENRAQEILYGRVSLDRTKSVFFNMLKGSQKVEGEKAIKTIVDAVDDAEMPDVWRAWRQTLPDEKIQELVDSGELSTNAASAVRALRGITDGIWEEVNKTQRATGNTVTQARQGHMGVSRAWLGDHRIFLRGDDNRIVGQASGFNRRGAQQDAVKLQKALEEEGISTHIAEAFDISELDNLPREFRTAFTPGFVLERQNVRGFRWDLEPFTKKELMDALTDAVYVRHKYMANMTVDDLLAPDRAKLAQENPTVSKMLEARMRDLAGIQSDWGKMQNRAADKLLAPMLGNNSATQIVAVTNNAMWHLSLGSGKMSYPAINALTFIQTVTPEIAFVTGRALPDALAPYYEYFAAGGTKGPAGIVAQPSVMKILYKSFREMGKPGPELNEAIERATREGVTGPRLFEEYFGEQSAKVSDLRSALSSPGGFAKWLLAVSEWVPAQSERFARAHSFTVGHVVGRDFLGLKDDALFTFAKQFTENTQYMYSAADRPRMLTTPAGSAFGLFKNWMMNYVAATLLYTNQAYKGNWAPLLWQTAGTMSLGGLAATPLYAVANGFSNAFADTSLLELSYDLFGETGGDALNFGLPAALTTASLYSQAATPLANPIRDANMLYSIAHYDRMQHLGRTVGEAFDAWRVDGQNPARNPRVRDHLVRALAPTSVYRVMGAVQEEGIRSLGSGLPLVMEATPAQKALYALGFTPVEMERGLAVAEELFKSREARQAATERLGQAYADAMQEGDSETMRVVLRQAVVQGVDPSSILRSAQSRAEKQEQDLLERNFRPQDLERFRRILESGS